MGKMVAQGIILFCFALFVAYLQSDDQSNKTEDPAEEEQRDDGENDIVRRLDLDKDSAFHWACLSHDNVRVARLLRWSSVVSTGRLWRGSSVAYNMQN